MSSEGTSLWVVGGDSVDGRSVTLGCNSNVMIGECVCLLVDWMVLISVCVWVLLAGDDSSCPIFFYMFVLSI